MLAAAGAFQSTRSVASGLGSGGTSMRPITSTSAFGAVSGLTHTNDTGPCISFPASSNSENETGYTPSFEIGDDPAVHFAWKVPSSPAVNVIF